MIKSVRYAKIMSAVGFFVADLGHWVAGHEWGVDLYATGIKHGLEFPADAYDYIKDMEDT